VEELVLPDAVGQEKLFASLVDFVSLMRKLGVVTPSAGIGQEVPGNQELPGQQVLPVQKEEETEK